MAYVETPLDIVGGLPYQRQIRIKNGTSIFPVLSQLEVKSQVRVAPDMDSTLRYTLTPHITPSIDGADIVLDLALTGQDTRLMPSGYYDIILSDPGAVDLRAIRVLGGKIKVHPLVTGA